MTYRLNRLTHCTDVSPADWIGPRLAPFGSGVTSIVPSGFAAYARVLHRPLSYAADVVEARWAEVAASTGRAAYPLMQWHAIKAGLGEIPDWDGAEPDEGELDPHQLPVLLGLLAQRTGTPDDAYHALWNGFGGWTSGAVVLQAWSEGELPPSYPDDPASVRPDTIPPVLPPEVTEGPLVRLPHREYLLFAGPVAAAADFEATRAEFTLRERQTPQLSWPSDLAWCVATEIDFDSTLVGGSEELVAAVLAEGELEAYPVAPDDDLTFTGDVINDPTGDLARRRYG
jgi:hypothetical protein